jgi:hypothetical protein
MKSLLVAMALLLAGGVFAQTSPPVGPKPIAALRWSQLSLREALPRLTRESGVLVLAETPLAGRRLTLNSVGGSLESVLDQVLAQLPKGVQLKRAFLPSAAATSPNPNPDLIATLIQINEALLTPMNPGAKVERDQVILQGRLVPKDKVAALLTSLDLKPVYLFVDPRSREVASNFVALQQDAMRLWQSMSPEQRKAAVDRQWEDFLNMDPNVRKQYMQQMGEQAIGIMQKIQQLPQEQQKELLGGLLPPGALGGGGN